MIVTGIHVSDANRRDSEGEYQIGGGGHWMAAAVRSRTHDHSRRCLGWNTRVQTEILPFVNEFVQLGLRQR